MGSARRLGSSDSPARSLRTGRPRTSRLGSCPRSDTDGTAAMVRTPETPVRGHGAMWLTPPPGGVPGPARQATGDGGRVYVRPLYAPRSAGAAERSRRVDQVHVVVMGCGRVGSDIARRLEAMGHSV